MPYKSEKIKIQGTKYDKRRKLTEQQKKDIHTNKAGLSQRKLAKLYNVSRRLIQFILDLEKQKANLQRRKERGGSKQYYKKEKNTVTMREHRRYKQNLFLTNKIKHDDK